MALSERPQHAAPGPLLALYIDSLQGWSGLPVAQHGNLGSGPLLALSVRSLHATWGTVWEIQSGLLMALPARPKHATQKPHRRWMKNLGHNSMGLP